VVFYDGQGFMVAKKLGVKSAKELNGATICVAPGTTSELNLADYFRATKMEFKPVVIEKVDELFAAFFSGRCDVISGDASGLAAQRAGRATNPDDYIVLPERISKEPLAPVVRHGDEQWHDIVDWVGGYPFEVARPEEVFDFYRAAGFELLERRTCGKGHGCNEFTFRRRAAGTD